MTKLNLPIQENSEDLIKKGKEWLTAVPVGGRLAVDNLVECIQ